MDMKKRDFLGLAAGVGAVAGLAAAGEAQAQGRRASPAGGPIPTGDRGLANMNVQSSTVDWSYKPRRINKAIELWEDGQPIYYNGSGLGPGVDPYAQGVKMARTWYDAKVEFEHGAIDFTQLREFMRGLVDGGPTRSGHRTPAVFVETGIIGLDEAYARANSWMFTQLLDCGIHGIHQCHARDTKAVAVTMQMGCRYPFKRPGIKDLPMRGLRGSAGGYAAQIWGVDLFKYNHVADLWPLNPKGEMIFGVKIEDTFADQQVEGTLALPGLSMAEWGPGDHSYWLYGLDVMPEDGSPPPDIIALPEMVAVRKRVLDLCKKNKVKFLNAGTTDPKKLDYVVGQIDDGAMVLECGEDAAIMGREHTKRKMPV